METIGNSEFRERIIKGERSFKNLKVTGGVKLLPEHLIDTNAPNHGLSISDCEFDLITLRDINLGIGLTLNNVKIKHYLRIHNCHCKVSTDFDLLPEAISLYDVKLGGTLEISDCIFEKSIELQKCQFADIECIRLTTKGAVQLNDSEINESCTFREIKTQKGLDIYEVKSTENFSLESISGSGIWLSHCGFEKELKLTKCEVQKLDFDHGTYQNDVEIDCLKTDSLTFFRSDFQRGFKITLGEVGPPENRFAGCIGNLKLLDTSFGSQLEVDMVECLIDVLNIEITPQFVGAVQFSNGNIRSLNFSGINRNGNFSFSQIKFSAINFDQFFNDAHISFSQNKPSGYRHSMISIRNSSLGSTQFSDFSFAHFDHVGITDSFINEISYSGVEWFETTHAHLVSQTPQETARNLRDIYRQLKQAAEKQGDRVQALRFKADEFSFYRQLLTHKIKELKGQKEQKKLRQRLWAERFSLWLSRFTNDLGQTWTRPLWQIFLITLIAYPLLVVAASEELTWWPFGNELAMGEGLSLLWQKAGAFPQLFNPARYLTRVFEVEHLPGIVYFIDALHRIVLTFYIYQIISAFRKYFK